MISWVDFKKWWLDTKYLCNLTNKWSLKVGFTAFHSHKASFHFNHFNCPKLGISRVGNLISKSDVNVRIAWYCNERDYCACVTRISLVKWVVGWGQGLLLGIDSTQSVSGSHRVNMWTVSLPALLRWPGVMFSQCLTWSVKNKQSRESDARSDGVETEDLVPVQGWAQLQIARGGGGYLVQ